MDKSINCRKLIISCFVFLILITSQSSYAGSLEFEKVVRALKGTVTAGISIGIDEAGGRLLGPTIWPKVKRLAEPILKELSASEKPTQEQVIKIVYALDNDEEVRQKIKQNYQKLSLYERDSINTRIDEIQERLITLENITLDTNYDVKYIKTLLLAILNSNSFTDLGLDSIPERLQRFDSEQSMMSIYYPRGISPPRYIEDHWLAGGWFDKFEPVYMQVQILGLSKYLNDKFDPDIYKVLANRLATISLGKCDPEDFEIPMQVIDKHGGILVVTKCDRTFPIPNEYKAARLFQSNGVVLEVSASVYGDENWEKFEKPVIGSLRKSNFREPCGREMLACCVPYGKFACVEGLQCKEKNCIRN